MADCQTLCATRPHIQLNYIYIYIFMCIVGHMYAIHMHLHFVLWILAAGLRAYRLLHAVCLPSSLQPAPLQPSGRRQLVSACFQMKLWGKSDGSYGSFWLSWLARENWPVGFCWREVSSFFQELQMQNLFPVWSAA